MKKPNSPLLKNYFLFHWRSYLSYSASELVWRPLFAFPSPGACGNPFVTFPPSEKCEELRLYGRRSSWVAILRPSWIMCRVFAKRASPYCFRRLTVATKEKPSSFEPHVHQHLLSLAWPHLFTELCLLLIIVASNLSELPAGLCTFKIFCCILLCCVVLCCVCCIWYVVLCNCVVLWCAVLGFLVVF